MSSYPVQKDLLNADPLLPWLDEHFLRSDPFAFEGSSFKKLALAISENFDVDPNGVFCIGSGAIGLSLNPAKASDTALKSFDKESDLDIAIISSFHFEEAWRNLRTASQPTVGRLSEDFKKDLAWQKKRFFDGAILTHKLLPYLSYSTQWTLARVRLEEYIAKLFDRNVDVNFWVYRDYWSVRNYVAEGAMKCKRKVQS